MSANPVFVLVQMDVPNPNGFATEYAMPLMKQLAEIGAEPLVATNAPDVIEGRYGRSNTAILRFPSRRVFDKWYASDAYATLKKKRTELSDDATTLLMVLPMFEGATG